MMKAKTSFKRSAYSSLGRSIVIAMSLVGTPAMFAYGQENEGEGEVEAESGGEALEEITITGSRIRRDDFSNFQPTTIIDSEFIENLGVVNIGVAMALLPANVGNNTPTANAGGNFFNGANIANLRGLNPFFGSRTLTLVDSRRHVSTNQGDSVDLNFIPSILIDRMEIVTGGASASYGSGAIGGVTNIILKHNLVGGEIQLDYGLSGEIDGNDLHYGFAWGSELGDKGHFVFALEGEDLDNIERCASARNWCGKNAGVVENTDFVSNGQPRFLHRLGVGSAYNTAAGTLVQGLGANNAFSLGRDATTAVSSNAAGTAFSPYNPGQYSDAGLAPTALGVGGEGDANNQYSLLQSGLVRQIIYVNFDYKISDNLGFFFEASDGSVVTNTPQDSIGLHLEVIEPDNAYLLQIDPDLFPAGAQFGKQWAGVEGVSPYNSTMTDMERFVFGFDGGFGGSSWTWDAYYQYGKSERSQTVGDNRHLTRFAYALDAVFAIPGNSNSQVVCRVTRDGVTPEDVADPRLAEGCIPITPFGTTITEAAYDYSFGFIKERTKVVQQLIEVVASGVVVDDLGFAAGPILGAVGFSRRSESMDNLAAENLSDYERTDFVIQYGESFSGDVDVIELFGEIDVPLTPSLDIQAAFRHSDYQTTAGAGISSQGESYSYGINTWKVNINWSPLSWLTLRASQSLDIRAPNFRELFYEQLLQQGGFGVCDNEWTLNTQDACTIHLLGGLDLEPEEADTTTFGFVLAPEFVDLRIAADYYEISIREAITPANSGLVLEECFANRNPLFCAQLEGERLNLDDPLGGFSDITDVYPTARNARSYKVKGIDISADWSGQFAFGSISTRVIATHTLEQIVQPTAGTTIDIVGITGGGANTFLSDWSSSPDWTAQWLTTYKNGPYIATAQARYVSSGLLYADRFDRGQAGYFDADGITPSSNSIDDNQMPGYTVWALNGSYAFDIGDASLSVFASINNLFDKDPPFTGIGLGVNPILFDTLGRSYRVGIRANF